MYTPNALSAHTSSVFGLQSQTQRLNDSAEKVATQAPETDLTNEVANQIEAKGSFSANIAILKTENKMMGTLLDLFA